jgi:hypothetical protein
MNDKVGDQMGDQNIQESKEPTCLPPPVPGETKETRQDKGEAAAAVTTVTTAPTPPAPPTPPVPAVYVRRRC